MTNLSNNYCESLPEIIELSSFGGDFSKYQEFLYNEIFLKQLYNYKLQYNNKLVELKRSPLYEGKEDSFFHLTCKIFEKNSLERTPDFRRSERLCWLKPAIEIDHGKLCQKECFLVYKRPFKRKTRICFLNPIDRYFVVLEERPGSYLLITAFYIDYDNMLEKKIKEYEKYKDY